MKIRPINDYIQVKSDPREEKTKGGLYIPQTSENEKPIKVGTVVSVSEKFFMANGVDRPLVVNVGERVLYGFYHGFKYEIDGEEYTLLREGEVLGIVEG